MSAPSTFIRGDMNGKIFDMKKKFKVSNIIPKATKIISDSKVLPTSILYTRIRGMYEHKETNV